MTTAEIHLTPSQESRLEMIVIDTMRHFRCDTTIRPASESRYKLHKLDVRESSGYSKGLIEVFISCREDAILGATEAYFFTIGKRGKVECFNGKKWVDALRKGYFWPEPMTNK